MRTEETSAMFKALADPSRLKILTALMEEGPNYVQELACRLELAESTASFHLKKLERAGLVIKARDQYYTMYWANHQGLEVSLKDLIASNQTGDKLQARRLGNYRAKVINTFFKNGKLSQLPIQKKKRRIVLEQMAALFQPDRDYSESEVNDIIADKYEDYCTIRREMTDGFLMERKHQRYRLRPGSTVINIPIPGPPLEEKGKSKKATIMKRRSELKKAYLQNPPNAGIYKISNHATGKIFIGKGMNVKGKLNGHQAQLKWGAHMNQELQQDWNKYGADQFSFEVIDTLKVESDTGRDIEADLAELERLWLDKLQPFGKKGYNRLPKERG